MIKEIADILKLDVGAISPAYNSIFSDNKGVYYVKDKVKIDSDIFEKFLKLKELKFLYFQKSVIFENCVFDKENLKKIQLIKYTLNLEFKNCVFKNVDLNSVKFPNYGKNRSFLNCEFENIDNFLEFVSNNTFKECFYKSDLKLYGSEKKEHQNKIKISNFTFNNKVKLIGKIFEKEVCFENVIFEDEVDFSNSTFNENILIYKCEFKKQLNFENCKFIESKGYTDNSLRFKEVRFNDIANFKNSVFDVEVNFDDFVFSNVANFTKSTFKKNASFKNCKFNKLSVDDFFDFSEIDFKDNVYFDDSYFNGKIDFSKSTFEKKVSFKNCKFNKLSGDDFFDFSEIDFKDNVYFDDSYFNEFVAFNLCVFEKTASFYKTKFKVIPNFSPGDFKGILNINNATWGQNGNIEFEDVENIVVKACGKIKTEKEKLEKEKLETEKELQTIRNIKDSFRAIKNVLIQKNDQLDAQKFHKAELYCKELELEKELETKNNKNFSTYIDSLLLRFYRNTSDHHTNFLKILNFTVFCIAVYAVCNFVFVGIYEATFFEETRFFSKEYSEEFFNYSFGFLIILTIFVLSPIILLRFTVILLYSFIFFCFFAMPLLIGWLYFSKFTNQNVWLLFKATIPMWISLYFFLIISFHTLWARLIDILNYFSKKNFFKNFFNYLYQKISYFYEVKFVDDVCKLVIWCIVAFVLYLQPQLINPFVGVFKSDEILPKNYFEKKLNDLNASEIIEISNLLKNITDLNLTKVHKEIIDLNTITNAGIINAKELIKQNLKEVNIANNDLNTTITTINDLKEAKDLQEYLVNGIKSSSLVYSIILLLCLYSLTKTARKNSIVPI
ncbi:MAG: hypothetical protein MR469_03915 [Campylobacter sp.]|uniref:pentapeptide repeat-containing protein n=1 Tax=Campylobacter sp. TaxID=205 RepID=UPI002AA88B2E|nr:hypothetical protein [Campylobacter sp.]MCI6694769.1 hypothetical protein [Campylobacter sp.]